MERRDFLGAAGMAGAAALAGLARAARAAETPKKQVLELRLYRAEAGAMRERLERFLAEVALPAWNRAGVRPVGVFDALDGSAADLYVLLPHESAEAFVGAAGRVWADAQYQQAGAAALDAPKDAPLYQRIESSVMLAFDGVPRVEAPAEKKASRVFQLRIYESHSDLKARRKIEMFNTGGELAIFRRVGMTPVFFGETLAGAKLPNLAYMLVFDDLQARDAAWKRFQDDPAWKALRADPQYKDTVSAITNLMLGPAACSQV